jgi:carboxylate-amine ligase
VGVEEELLLVDEQSLVPVGAARRVVEAAAHEGVKLELLAAFVETTTGVCDSPREASAQLRALRARAAEAARAEGLRILAIGSHPFAEPEDQPITENPTYLEFAAAVGPAARRQGVCGLHVHVGMPDADTCVRAHERVLPWLPVVLALAANSPWFRGAETGLLSTRAEILATLPRSATPPPFSTWREWEEMVERWQRAGVLERPTQTWWDARVHPALGTLELRVADQPTDAGLAVAIVALLHALGVWAAQEDGGPASRADYHTNRFFASRFGPRASLIHPYEDRLALVPELYGELLELIRPHADLALLASLDPAFCEADRQLAADDPLTACRDALRRSVPSPA